MRRPVSLFNSQILVILVTVACVQVLFVPQGWTRVEYDSQQLLMKNAEQIGAIVKKKMQKAQDIQAAQEDDDDAGIRAEPAAIDEFKDAMRIVLSRPDQDGARSNVFGLLKRELTDLNSFDDVVKDLTNEAIDALRSEKTPVKHQKTYVVLLEGLMAELKPDLSTSPLAKLLIEQIRDADLKISDKLKNQDYLRTMSRPVSPSDTAAKILPKDGSKKK